MVLQVDGLGERQSAYRALVVLLAAVQLFVRPKTRVARERAAANVAVKRFLDLCHGGDSSADGAAVTGRLNFHVLMANRVAAHEYDARSVALVAFGDGRRVPLLHRIVARHQVATATVVLAVLDFGRLDGMDDGLLGYGQRIHFVLFVGVAVHYVVANVHLADLEFDVAIGRDKDLRGRLAAVVVCVCIALVLLLVMLKVLLWLLLHLLLWLLLLLLL